MEGIANWIFLFRNRTEISLSAGLLAAWGNGPNLTQKVIALAGFLAASGTREEVRAGVASNPSDLDRIVI